MSLTTQQVALMLQAMRQKFPSWNSFDDTDFVTEEIAYKQVAVQKAQALLGKEALQNLLSAGNYDAVIQNLATVGKTANLLYLSTPNSSDLNILFRDNLDKEGFTRAVFSLLWGVGDSPTRLQHYLDYVVENDLPNKWTFPTYFLFLCHPETDLFIKPYGVIQPFLKLIGSELVLTEKPEAECYAALLQLAQDIKVALAAYGPRNLVHIQSLMFVCANTKPIVPPPITPQTKFWKVAPAENAHLWNQCRSGRYIAIGWPEVGDVRTITRREFEMRRDAAVDGNRDLSPDGIEQLWKFAREIKIGDRIVANQGTTKVCGIGVVTGPCEYVEGIHYRHRLPVHWYDKTPRQVEQKGWLRTLVDLRRETFDAIIKAPALIETKYWRFSSTAPCWDWELCRSAGAAVLGHDGFGDISGMHPREFRRLRDELLLKNTQLTKHDLDAVFTLTQLSPGDSIVAVDRDSRQVLGYGQVTGAYYFDGAAPQFKHRLPVQWQEAESRLDMVGGRKTLEEISPNSFKNLTGQEIITPPLPDPVLDPVDPKPTMKAFPLNQILYGPPGTGKTYNTINMAVEIIEGVAPKERDICTARFEELRAAGRIGFVTFHQSFSYEEFIEGLRPVVDNTATAGARYAVRDGVFKEMALRALGTLLPGKQTEKVAFDVVWELFQHKVASQPDWTLPGIDSAEYKVTFSSRGTVIGDNINGNAQAPYTASPKNIEKVWNELPPNIKPSHNALMDILQKGSHTNLIGAIVQEMRKLEPLATEEMDVIEKARRFLHGNDQAALANAPRFVLIVDEINRGNISKIFGELITLLEPDKRLGETNALRLILPYSGETLALPPNLYLLGTMNTADKSLALLDVALRRRFTFKEIRPDFTNQDICTGLTPAMRGVLLELNKRIMLVLDREHRLGHSFFIGVQSPEDFNAVFADKIVPLLQEYFYNDWGGLCSVLGEKENGKIISVMPKIDGVKERNRYAWWHDLDLPNPDFFSVLCQNFNVANGPASAAESADPDAA